jgi:hypothetical protein
MMVGRRAVFLSPLQRLAIRRLMAETSGVLPNDGRWGEYTRGAVWVAISQLRAMLAPEYRITQAYNRRYRLVKEEN